MTELLGLGGWGASRGRHRCGAVWRVLLWRARLIDAVFGRRVGRAGPRSGGILGKRKQGGRGLCSCPGPSQCTSICHLQLHAALLTSLDTSTTRSSLFSPSLSCKMIGKIVTCTNLFPAESSTQLWLNYAYSLRIFSGVFNLLNQLLIVAWCVMNSVWTSVYYSQQQNVSRAVGDLHICSCCLSPLLCVSWSPNCSQRSCGASHWMPVSFPMEI